MTFWKITKQIAGEVVAVKAFLSNNKKYVYSEFTIRIDEVLKKSESGKPGLKKVTADREGGVVIYPGGQRVMYQDSALGLPRLGSRYLFFLRKEDESPNYAIITSYDLDGVRPRQVEMGRNFDQFKDLEKTEFMGMIRNRIARTPNK